MDTENFKQDLEKNGKLMDDGRGAASVVLKSAIDTCKGAKEFSDAIFVIKCTAIHLLATEALNCEKQNSVKVEDFVSNIKKGLLEEIEICRKMEAVTKDSLEKKDKANDRCKDMSDEEYNLRTEYHRLEGYSNALNDYGIWRNGTQYIGCLDKSVKGINKELSEKREKIWQKIDVLIKARENE